MKRSVYLLSLFFLLLGSTLPTRGEISIRFANGIYPLSSGNSTSSASSMPPPATLCLYAPNIKLNNVTAAEPPTMAITAPYAGGSDFLNLPKVDHENGNWMARIVSGTQCTASGANELARQTLRLHSDKMYTLFAITNSSYTSTPSIPDGHSPSPSPSPVNDHHIPTASSLPSPGMNNSETESSPTPFPSASSIPEQKRRMIQEDSAASPLASETPFPSASHVPDVATATPDQSQVSPVPSPSSPASSVSSSTPAAVDATPTSVPSPITSSTSFATPSSPSPSSSGSHSSSVSPKPSHSPSPSVSHTAAPSAVSSSSSSTPGPVTLVVYDDSFLADEYNFAVYFVNAYQGVETQAGQVANVTVGTASPETNNFAPLYSWILNPQQESTYEPLAGVYDLHFVCTFGPNSTLPSVDNTNSTNNSSQNNSTSQTSSSDSNNNNSTVSDPSINNNNGTVSARSYKRADNSTSAISSAAFPINSGYLYSAFVVGRLAARDYPPTIFLLQTSFMKELDGSSVSGGLIALLVLVCIGIVLLTLCLLATLAIYAVLSKRRTGKVLGIWDMGNRKVEEIAPPKNTHLETEEVTDFAAISEKAEDLHATNKCKFQF